MNNKHYKKAYWRALILTVMIVSASSFAFAQIKSGKDVQTVETRYVVSDSAVFVYYLGNKDMPYKVYDFSTRSVYVYFGETEERRLAQHSFGDLDPKEVEYIRDIGCDGVALSSSFRRFCK